MKTPGRRPPDSSGRAGEDLAARHLRRLGFRIVARNLRTTAAEIDILVRRRRTYAAVEVKSRAHHPAPERAVSIEQVDRLEEALRRLTPRLRPRPHLLRVDIVAVRWPCQPRQDPEIRHFAGTPFPAPNDP